MNKKNQKKRRKFNKKEAWKNFLDQKSKSNNSIKTNHYDDKTNQNSNGQINSNVEKENSQKHDYEQNKSFLKDKEDWKNKENNHNYGLKNDQNNNYEQSESFSNDKKDWENKENNHNYNLKNDQNHNYEQTKSFFKDEKNWENKENNHNYGLKNDQNHNYEKSKSFFKDEKDWENKENNHKYEQSLNDDNGEKMIENNSKNFNNSIEIKEEQNDLQNFVVDIKVLGVGGGGNNAINEMIADGLEGAQFIAINTDRQVLNKSKANKILEIGKKANGLGAGAKPEQGKIAAEESIEDIEQIIDNANLVIISAGMGGGTGTGAAPIIAKKAKEKGILTVAIVTTPFKFEGRKRNENALIGIEELKKYVDAIIIVSNDKLREISGDEPLDSAFAYANRILKDAVRTITDLINSDAIINLDFEDLATTIKNKGNALIGIGRASGEDRAIKAARNAVSSPILEKSIEGATHAIVNVLGSDLTINEAEKAVKTIVELTNKELDVLFGVSKSKHLKNEIQVSVIATGIKDNDYEFDESEEIPVNQIEEKEISSINDELVDDDEDSDLPDFI